MQPFKHLTTLLVLFLGYVQGCSSAMQMPSLLYIALALHYHFGISTFVHAKWTDSRASTMSVVSTLKTYRLKSYNN